MLTQQRAQRSKMKSSLIHQSIDSYYYIHRTNIPMYTIQFCIFCSQLKYLRRLEVADSLANFVGILISAESLASSVETLYLRHLNKNKNIIQHVLIQSIVVGMYVCREISNISLLFIYYFPTRKIGLSQVNLENCLQGYMSIKGPFLETEKPIFCLIEDVESE